MKEMILKAANGIGPDILHSTIVQGITSIILAILTITAYQVRKRYYKPSAEFVGRHVLLSVVALSLMFLSVFIIGKDIYHSLSEPTSISHISPPLPHTEMVSKTLSTETKELVNKAVVHRLSPIEMPSNVEPSVLGDATMESAESIVVIDPGYFGTKKLTNAEIDNLIRDGHAHYVKKGGRFLTQRESELWDEILSDQKQEHFHQAHLEQKVSEK